MGKIIDEVGTETNLSLNWGEVPDEEQKKMNKTALDRAVSSYHRDWRLLQEALQNSIDSFIQQDTEEADPIPDLEEAVIDLSLDLDGNLVTIQDNGQGIPIKNAGMIIRPYTGTKDGSERSRNWKRKLKGNQGIGLKAAVFASSYFYIESRTKEGDWWSYECPNDTCENSLHESLKDEIYDIGQIKDLTLVTEGDELSKLLLKDSDRGTIIKIQQHDFSVKAFIVEKINSWKQSLDYDYTLTNNVIFELSELRKGKKRAKKKENLAKTRWENQKISLGGEINPNEDQKCVNLNGEYLATRGLHEEASAGVREKEEEIVQIKTDFEQELNAANPDSPLGERKKIVEGIKASIEAIGDDDPDREDEKKRLEKELEIQEVPDGSPRWNLMGGSGSKARASLMKLDKAFAHYLRLDTYAADLSRHLMEAHGLPPIKITIQLYGNSDFLSERGFEISEEAHVSSVNYLQPTQFDATIVFHDFTAAEWKEFIEENVVMGPNHILKVHFRNSEEIKILLGSFPIDSDDKPKRKWMREEARETLHRTALGCVNGITLYVGNSENLRWFAALPPKAIISVNGFPGVEQQLDTKKWSTSGYLHGVHLVIDVDANLTIGKRLAGGEAPGIYTKRVDTINNFAKTIWTNIRATCQLIIGKDARNAEKPPQYIEHDIPDESFLEGKKLSLMTENFGRVTIPHTEQDIIQMHNYWMGKQGIMPAWISLNTRTEVDGLTLETLYEQIEYKGPENGSPKQRGVGKLILNNQSTHKKQSFETYHLAVVWEQPSLETIQSISGAAAYMLTSASDEPQTPWPPNEVFPHHALYWISDREGRERWGSDDAFIFSLKDVWDKIVEENPVEREAVQENVESTEPIPKKDEATEVNNS